MLKPRKQKRLQFVKIVHPQSRRVTGGRLYVGKHRSCLITWSAMANVATQLQAMVEDRCQLKGDFFQEKKPYRDIFRTLKACWVLSWVPGREQLYFLRKFPRPMPKEDISVFLDKLKRFNGFGVNANKEQVCATVASLDHVIDRDVEFAYMTPTVPLLNGDALKAKMSEIALKFPNINIVTANAINLGDLTAQEIIDLDTAVNGPLPTTSYTFCTSTPSSPDGKTFLEIIKGRDGGGYTPVFLDSLSEHPEVKQEFNMNTNSPYDSLYKDDKDA